MNRCVTRSQNLSSAAHPAFFFKGAAGSALIALIAALLIFSVLATAIIPLIGSSGQQAVVSDLATQAYFMAESGFRYANGRYTRNSASPLEQNNILETLGGTYALAEGDRFMLTVYAYFYEIMEDVNASAMFVARTPGVFPRGTTNLQSGQKLLIGDTLSLAHIYTISAVAFTGPDDDPTITFSVDRPLAGAVKGDMVYPVVETIDSLQVLSNGGHLYYKGAPGNLLPPKNGWVRINGRTLFYHFNEVHAGGNNRLMDIRDPNESTFSDFPAPAGSPIALARYAHLKSTGIAGAGGMETRRTVNYYNAFSGMTVDTYAVEEKIVLDDLQSAAGAHSLEIVGGEQGGVYQKEAIMVTAVDDSHKSLLVLKTDKLKEVFSASRRASGGYLSYDVQAKVGFILPHSVPDAFSAGISFRLEQTASAYNGYGLSFLRDDARNRLPQAMAPENSAGKKMIVLWRQTDDGRTYKWLAYKTISGDTLFSDDFTENKGWRSSTSMWRYASNEGEWRANRNDPESDEGWLTSPEVLLPPQSTGLTLSFYSQVDKHPSDTIAVYLATNDTLYTLLAQSPDDGAARAIYPLDDAFAGKTIRIAFYYRRGDQAIDDTTNGWFIDEVTVTHDWPIHNATLVARLKEAAVLRFFGGGPAAIQKGDRIFGRDSATRATVIASPILSDGHWADRNARGTLLLNTVIGDQGFSTGEALILYGGDTVASVAAFDNTMDRKVNVIRAYYASEKGYGQPDDSPLTLAALGYERLSADTDALIWPTSEDGNWTARQDYFRLIQWDAINSQGGTDDPVGIASLKTPRAILRHHHPDLQSPARGIAFNRSEIGLHSYGGNAGAVYFDDFGVIVFISPDRSFPLQQ